MSRRLYTLLAVAALSLPGSAFAQTPGAPSTKAAAAKPAGKGDKSDKLDEAQREARRQAHEKLRAEVLDQMRAMRMWKLTEELKLDQTAAATVFPILAEYDDRAREIGRERREIGREVFRETQGKEGKPDEPRLRELINKLLANQIKRNALDEERFKALRPALTALQQAKMLLLLPKLEDDFRRRIREAMEAQKRAEGGQADGRSILDAPAGAERRGSDKAPAAAGRK